MFPVKVLRVPPHSPLVQELPSVLSVHMSVTAYALSIHFVCFGWPFFFFFYTSALPPWCTGQVKTAGVTFTDMDPEGEVPDNTPSTEVTYGPRKSEEAALFCVLEGWQVQFSPILSLDTVTSGWPLKKKDFLNTSKKKETLDSLDVTVCQCCVSESTLRLHTFHFIDDDIICSSDPGSWLAE